MVNSKHLDQGWQKVLTTTKLKTFSMKQLRMCDSRKWIWCLLHFEVCILLHSYHGKLQFPYLVLLIYWNVLSFFYLCFLCFPCSSLDWLPYQLAGISGRGWLWPPYCWLPGWHIVLLLRYPAGIAHQLTAKLMHGVPKRFPSPVPPLLMNLQAFSNLETSVVCLGQRVQKLPVKRERQHIT